MIKQTAAFVVILGMTMPLTPVFAYDNLEADFEICTKGTLNGERVIPETIVDGCTQLINNSEVVNETVGLFYAIRASNNTNKRQNCDDAKTASQAIKDPGLQNALRELVAANCR